VWAPGRDHVEHDLRHEGTASSVKAGGGTVWSRGGGGPHRPRSAGVDAISPRCLGRGCSTRISGAWCVAEGPARSSRREGERRKRRKTRRARPVEIGEDSARWLNLTGRRAGSRGLCALCLCYRYRSPPAAPWSTPGEGGGHHRAQSIGPKPGTQAHDCATFHQSAECGSKTPVAETILGRGRPTTPKGRDPQPANVVVNQARRSPVVMGRN